MDFVESSLVCNSSSTSQTVSNGQQPRRVVENGRSYLIVPATSIVHGVLAGSKGALYYPLDEIGNNVAQWDKKPLVAYHPILNGMHVSASTPGIWEKQGLGEIRNTTFNGSKLKHELWFDEEKTGVVDNRILRAITNGQKIELSTGLFTDNEVAPDNSHHNGKPYNYIARNYRADHLAILPDQVGACSLNDGCGVYNKQQLVVNYREWMSSVLTDNANPEGCNQYKSCGSGSSEAKQSVGEIKGKDTQHKKSTDDRLKAHAIVEAAYGRHLKRTANEPDPAKRAASHEQHKQEIKDAGVVPIKGGYTLKGKGSQNPRTYKESTFNEGRDWLVSNYSNWLSGLITNANPEGINQYTKGATGHALKHDILKYAKEHGGISTTESSGPTSAKTIRDLRDTLGHSDFQAHNPLGNPVHKAAVELIKSGHLNREDRGYSGARLTHAGKEYTKNVHRRPECEDGEEYDDEGEDCDMANNVDVTNAIGPPMSSPFGARDPHEASKHAATATLHTEHDAARDDALSAMDNSREGNSEWAAEFHNKAAEIHEAAATDARKEGNDEDADPHDAAAALHRRAASMHTAKPIQPQAPVEGEQPMSTNSGTTNTNQFNFNSGSQPGHLADADREQVQAAMAAMAEGGGEKRGAAVEATQKANKTGSKKHHAEAAAAHKSAKEYYKRSGDSTKFRQHDQLESHHLAKGKASTRNQKLITDLQGMITNCSCQGTRNQLLQMLENAKAEASFADTKGSGELQVGGEETTSKDKNDEEWEDDVNIQKKGLSVNQWMATAPPEVQDMVNNAIQRDNHEKHQIVTQLLVNVSDTQRRQELGNRLMKESMNRLQERLEMMPRPATNNRQHVNNLYQDPTRQPGFLPNYLGSGSPLFNQGGVNNGSGGDGENADILELPTINWGEVNEENRSLEKELERRRA